MSYSGRRLRVESEDHNVRVDGNRASPDVRLARDHAFLGGGALPTETLAGCRPAPPRGRLHFIEYSPLRAS